MLLYIKYNNVNQRQYEFLKTIYINKKFIVTLIFI